MTAKEIAKANELGRFWSRAPLSDYSLNTLVEGIRRVSQPKGPIFTSEDACGEYVAVHSAALSKYFRRRREIESSRRRR